MTPLFIFEYQFSMPQLFLLLSVVTTLSKGIYTVYRANCTTTVTVFT
jgi:hypothetical protein